MNDKENLLLIEVVLDQMHELFDQDPDGVDFSSESIEDWDSDDEFEDPKRKNYTKRKYIHIRYDHPVNRKREMEEPIDPKIVAVGEKYAKLSHVSIQFDSLSHIICIHIDLQGTHCSRKMSYDIGGGASNAKIKRSFFDLQKKCLKYRTETLPRKKRELFVNNLIEAFPNALDKLVLGEHDDEKK